MDKTKKEIMLGAAVVLLGLFAWYFLRYIFYVGGLTVSCWIWGGILFILFGIALCLAMLLIKNKAILFGSMGLTFVLFFIFFHNEPFRYLIPLGLAVGLFLSLKLVSLFYVPIVIMLSWLAIKILIKLNFVKSEKIQKEVESVSL